ncbi:MAG TPA: MotA/TolQ/ExbB proton channel family protein [Longimicrobiales bacterium]|nr:MotA/TolQ/ExbB proton channel family protein [Longimicrobiales bacterium]
MEPCPKCGAKTSPEHSFCLECGTILEKGPDPASQGGSAVASRLPPPGPTGTPSPRGGQDGPKGRRPRRATEDFAIPMVVAVVLTLLVYQLINSVVPPEAYAYRLFRPAGGWIMSLVPALILLVFIWTITDLILKFRIAGVNESDLSRSDVTRLPAQVAQESTSATLQRLRSWDGRMLGRPVGRRILSVLQHLDTVEPQRAHELIRHQSDIEADAAASGYRTVKLFIWAMPILGFIGTVLGISLAVGGFSDFLTTDVSIDEIDTVTAELGEVAQGLSFAFDTTLLGLLAGLVASVVSSGVQARDERLLTRLENLTLRIMETATPGPGASTAVARAGDPSGEFDKMMQSRLNQLSGQMDQFTKAVRVGLDGFLGEWAKLPPEVEKVAADMTGLRQHLSTAAESTDQLILETRVLLEGLREASQTMGTGLEASIGSVTGTVEGLGNSLQSVSDGLARNLLTLSERVAASEAQLQSGLAGLVAAIEANHRNGQGTAEAVHALSASVTDLGEQLREFRDAQAALTPILGQLAGPLELRLLPVSTRGDQG